MHNEPCMPCLPAFRQRSRYNESCVLPENDHERYNIRVCNEERCKRCERLATMYADTVFARWVPNAYAYLEMPRQPIIQSAVLLRAEQELLVLPRDQSRGSCRTKNTGSHGYTRGEWLGRAVPACHRTGEILLDSRTAFFPVGKTTDRCAHRESFLRWVFRSCIFIVAGVPHN